MPGSIQSVERAAAILRLLAESDEPLTLQQLSTALELAKGTVHGLLGTLQAVGFVDQPRSGGPYQVSEELAGLGHRRIDPNELRSRALNWTDALAGRTGHSARLAVFRDGRVEVAHSVFGSGAGTQETSTGTALPLHATALGKVLAAFDPAAGRAAATTDLTSYTFRTLTDRTALYRELAAVRDAGWASAVDEAEPDLADLAAPVRDRNGYVVAAVGVDGPRARLCDTRGRPDEALAAQVVRAGREISRELGHGRDA